MKGHIGSLLLLLVLAGAVPVGALAASAEAPVEREGATSVALTGEMVERARHVTGDRARPLSAWRVGADVAVIVSDGQETATLWLLGDGRAALGSLFDSAGDDLSMRVLRVSGLLALQRPSAPIQLPPAETSVSPGPTGAPGPSQGLEQSGDAMDPATAAAIALGDPQGVPIEVYWDPRCPYCDRLYREAERLGALKADSGVRWLFIPVPALGQDSYLPAARLLEGGAQALADHMAGRPPDGEPSPESRARVLLAAKHLHRLSGGKGGVPYLRVRGREGMEGVAGLPQDLDAFIRRAKQG